MAKKIDCPKTKKALYCRARQAPPSKFAKASYRTVTRGSLRVVVACPKGKWKRSRCSTGMQVQTILHPKTSKVCRKACRK